MKPRIIFSHGNSFPASTYRVLFDNLRQRGFQVDAIEKFGHDPKYPVTNNWPHLVQQLADFAHEKQGSGGPAFLVGHSLGGILSLMCAARHPELARGVVLVDSPVLGGWRATTLGLAKRTPLIGALSPGRISQKRRHHWPNTQAALESFAHKNPLHVGTRKSCRTTLTTAPTTKRANAYSALTATSKPRFTTACRTNSTACSSANPSNAPSPSSVARIRPKCAKQAPT